MNNNRDFTFQFLSSKSAKEIFPILLDVKSWWKGFYGENIQGESNEVGDEFTFFAGDGVHISKQKLIEKRPNKKLAWQVIESNLSFLNDKKEWDDTIISFSLEDVEKGTKVKFTHQGLMPEIECYEDCSLAWTNYLKNLEINLK